MRRVILFLLLIFFLFNLCGCGMSGLDNPNKVQFYYEANSLTYKTSSSILVPERRDCTLYKDDDLALVNYYFAGPESETCKSPFPSEVRATKLTVSSDTVNIYMNDRFSDIKGLKFTVACACLSQTLMELYQRDHVKIFAARSFSDGSVFVEISKDTLLLWDVV